MEPHRISVLVFFPCYLVRKKSVVMQAFKCNCRQALARSHGSMFSLASEIDMAINLHKNLSSTIAVHEVTPCLHAYNLQIYVSQGGVYVVKF